MVARYENRGSPHLRVNANVAYQATRASAATSHAFVTVKDEFSGNYAGTAEAIPHPAPIARAMGAC